MALAPSDAEVRVRFAPSPTGYLHVGGVRTLLFNWLYAKNRGGKLILRIEDTDQKRSTRESEQLMMSDIHGLDIDYDEGPDKPGPYGPYRQSERMGIYADHARKLLDAGKAFYCFCTDEEITRKREVAMKMGKQPLYDGTCRKVSRAEADARLKKGDKAGIRFMAPDQDIAFDDAVRGTVTFKAGTIGDFMITRTPTDEELEKGLGDGLGMPVYNFAVVVDDALMKINHVLRAEEHLANTPKQIMLFEALGFPVPKFAHMAMVLGSDRQKLSKRNGDTSTHDYLAKGFLPDAMLNFLSLLGWWPPAELKPASGHPEILSRAELIRTFSLDGLQKAAAVFDMQKLLWMNSFYIKALSGSEVAKLARPYFEASELPAVAEGVKKNSEAWLISVMEAVKGSVNLISELPQAAAFLFGAEGELDASAKEVLSQPTAGDVVKAFEAALQARPEKLTEQDVADIQKEVGAKTSSKGKLLFMPMRVAATGQAHGPELKLVIPLLGREGVLKRVNLVKRQMGLA
ncbi:MAG: glutamate--tRNA ligase [Bdellovibrionales bacterium]|nr:glutamate--tRNA ligase [Bdellovibrionales bacterium]